MAVSSASRRRQELGAELIEASFCGLHREVQRLLDEGADVEAEDRGGYTAISEAAVAGHTPVIGQLLRALADPNHAARDGRTALHRAAFHGWSNAVQLLLDNGADPALLDEGRETAAALARQDNVRAIIEGFAPARTRELIEERRRKLAERPPPKEPEPAARPKEEPDAAPAACEAKRSEAEAAAGTGGDTAAVAADSTTQAFLPPPRLGDKKKKLSRAEKERRYREALAELEAEVGSCAEAEREAAMADAFPRLTARFEVMGAGEERLNGVYLVSFLSKDRVEFEKVDDDQCQVFWCQYHNEWRMLIGDYKLGSTLYRHSYKPNLKADECHGVPEDGWQKWFGKDPEPLVCKLPPLSEDEWKRLLEEEAAEKEEDEAVDDGKARVIGPEGPPRGIQESAENEGSAAAPRSEQEVRREFLELHPRLKIVNRDEQGASRRSAREEATAARSRGGAGAEVRLGDGGRLVETAEGLFAPEEVAEEDVPLASSGGAEEHARAWLRTDVGDAPPVPAAWEAVHAAKTAAQDLYKEGRVAEARQATTAAIIAMQRLAKGLASLPLSSRGTKVECARPGEEDEEDDEGESASKSTPSTSYLPTDAEMEQLDGVLHSNRSLLVQQQIQAEDEAVLGFGREAAWTLVIDDADVALRADAGNFKASFRRARALFELGELDSALTDANRVVDHYARTSATPNPEAAALRDQIMEALRRDRSKWGQRGPARWNRGTAGPLVTEASDDAAGASAQSGGGSGGRTSAATVAAFDAAPAAALAALQAARSASSASGGGTASARSGGGRSSTASASALSSASRAPAAPRSGADVEKALMGTLRRDPAQQLAYVKEHLSAAVLRRLYRRTPLGPDLLGTLIVAIAELAQGGDESAEKRLSALAESPSALTHAAMFDAKERSALQQLLGKVSAEAAAPWRADESQHAGDGDDRMD
eukprot:TRINITY_DN1433_c0_g2_i1.p1 TRINITY_DN1433_c0_g2~~TRINITY_DN1433_c0_g2_i1.p1  ORF type:complete len:937 (-),score=287.72 TRINITY_DN1433_c0_g2_i1:88-2898(-)